LLGPAAVAAVPGLTEAVEDPSDDVRTGAVCALGFIGSAAAVPAVVRALADEEAAVARRAASRGAAGQTVFNLPAAAPSIASNSRGHHGTGVASSGKPWSAVNPGRT